VARLVAAVKRLKHACAAVEMTFKVVQAVAAVLAAEWAIVHTAVLRKDVAVKVVPLLVQLAAGAYFLLFANAGMGCACRKRHKGRDRDPVHLEDLADEIVVGVVDRLLSSCSNSIWK
jgi:hypothetical protein